MRGHLPPSRWAAALATVALVVSACQDNPTFEPEFARIKPDRTLKVTGAGTGSGKVMAPQVLEVLPMLCGVSQGSYDPTECSRTYPWKSSVTLTAAADPGSSFAGWSGACTGTGATCRVTMTQARSVQASFSGGGLPSFALNVAGGGTGSGAVRTPTGFNPAISCNITAGSATSGTCSASYQSGTVVTLNVTAASGHQFTGWTGDCGGTGGCSLTISENRAVTATFEAPVGPEATVGRWAAPANMDAVAIHLTQLANGRVLFWGHAEEPFTLNPAGGGSIRVPNGTCAGTNCELFCAGHTYIADGRLLVAGGHNETLGDGHGLAQSSTFDGTSWQVSGGMVNGRWYPTLVTLDNGSVVALSGSSAPGTNVQTPEVWTNGSWRALTGAAANIPLYPRAFLEPKNGWVYVAGEGTPRYLNPTAAGQWITTGVASRVVSDRSYGSAVMLDTKVLYIGGGGGSTGSPCALPQNSAEIIDLATASPTWSSVAPMSFRRRQTNATILPDGTVLVTGGTAACGFSVESGAVFAAEVYNPATNSWAVLSNASAVRVYHSTTTLMPDGRILVTGSGEPGGGTNQKNYEVFSPPYLFKGARPTYSLSGLPIRSGRPAVSYGQPFVVQTPDAASIRRVTLIRLASTTHAFDMGQRLNTLAFTAAGASVTVTPPASGKLAPPGPYQLFIVNDRGVPSVAETVLLGP